jgi:pullulanase
MNSGDLTTARAHWVSRDIILWPTPMTAGHSYTLHHADQGGLQLSDTGIVGGETITLAPAPDAGATFREIAPHLASYSGFRLPVMPLARLRKMLRSQLAVLTRDENGTAMSATGLQLPFVLDAVYAEAARHKTPGVSWRAGKPTLAVWAPTARNVTLLLFTLGRSAAPTRVPMTLDAASGVWRVTGAASWAGLFYLYEIDVFVRARGRFVTSTVTDPYSISLSTNSTHSQIVDLSAGSLFPAGWTKTKRPPFAGQQNAVLYELHVRDFSINDESVPAALRGCYGAFDTPGGNGHAHLVALARAGLTHVHLLPVFDFATVEEDAGKRQTPDANALSAMPPDSDRQTAALESLKGRDGFNWGYDPQHFFAPEGGYATDPDGPARILEFRSMVQGLHRAGLRVVMDMVFNHTYASGLGERSVLDKAVPGYYHRLNAAGDIEHSTCCENTASEHAMMEKLMVDNVLMWVRQYRVDGFRFDLMGHHMVRNMLAIRAALNTLTESKDGIDGASIILYGEGWNFGEVASGARGVNAIQAHLAGTGIATFSDRMRDAIRGGGPFGNPREAGFATGLYFAASSEGNADREGQRQQLIARNDLLRLNMAGSLRDYPLPTPAGVRLGAHIDYNGSPAGFAQDPAEVVNYASAHDNETLFDKIQWAMHPDASTTERVRMNNLANAIIALSQGLAFFHAGDDILRSKSLDRDSYNSGDWFNAIDWTYSQNNWGKGLPPSIRDRWPLAAPLLADPRRAVTQRDILFARDVFREFLRIRASSGLFRLPSGAAVKERVTFLNTGPDQQPGLIVMNLDGAGLPNEPFRRVVVLVNCAPEPASFADASFKDAGLVLHPVQQGSVDSALKQTSFDAATGLLTAPARSAVVWVERN